MDADLAASALFVGVGVVLFRVAWGLAVWFSHPESAGGWVARALLVWTLGKAAGLI